MDFTKPLSPRIFSLRFFLRIVCVGFLLVLLAALVVFLPGSRDRNIANIEVSNLTSILANIAQLFAAQEGRYGGLNLAMANQARVFPTSMNDGDTSSSAQIRSSWGGRVSLSSIPADSEQRFYVITYHNVSSGNCLGFVSGAAPSIDQIQVNGFPLFTDDMGETKAASEGGAFNPKTAAERCSSNNSSTIELTVR